MPFIFGVIFFFGGMILMSKFYTGEMSEYTLPTMFIIIFLMIGWSGYLQIKKKIAPTKFLGTVKNREAVNGGKFLIIISLFIQFFSSLLLH